MAVTRLRELERDIRRRPSTVHEERLQKNYEKRQADAYKSATIGKKGYVK